MNGDTSLSAALRDTDGNTSSKRVAGFLSIIMFAGALVADGFGHKIDEYFVNDLMVIICACFGFAVAERFAPQGK